MPPPPPDRSSKLSQLVALPQPVLHSILAAVLDEVVGENDRLPTKGVVTRFHAKVPSKLAVVDYLSRLVAGMVAERRGT